MRLFNLLFLLFGIVLYSYSNSNTIEIKLSSLESQQPLDSSKYSGAGVAVSPSHIHFTVEPGKSQVQKVKVTNDTNKTNAFKVNFFDFNMNGKGKSNFLPAGNGEYSLSKWINVSPSFLELKPGEKRDIIITVEVPDDDESNRAAWCVMMIEQAKEKMTLDPGRGKGQTIAMGVTPTFAFGVFLYQNPPNVEINKVEIVNFKFTQNKAGNMMQLDVENQGDGISYCTSYVELTNLNTGEQQRLLVKNFTIVPSLIREFYFRLPENVSGGNYSAVAVLDFGSDDELHAAELEFSFE